MMSNFADITYNKNKHFDRDNNFNMRMKAE